MKRNNKQISIDATIIDSLPDKLFKNSDWYHSFDTNTTYTHKNYALRFSVPLEISPMGGSSTSPRIYKDKSLIFDKSDMYETRVFKPRNYHNPFVGDSIMLQKLSGDLVLLNLKEVSKMDLPLKHAQFHDASLSEELFLVSTNNKICLIDEDGKYKHVYENEKGKTSTFTTCFWYSQKNYFLSINHHFNSREIFFNVTMYDIREKESIAQIDLMYLIEEHIISKNPEKMPDAVCSYTYDDVEDILYLTLESLNKLFEKKYLKIKIGIE